MPSPLPDRVRPKNIDEVCGQHHLLDKGKVLRRIIDSSEIKTDVVTPGAKITLEIEGNECVFTLVGTSEADPSKRMISYESPIGAAVLNHAVGEVVQATTPAGVKEVKIVKIG